jgi:hypothetical protein
MRKSIRLSEKHGLNPTLAVCAWCGEETGEIALLGYMGKGDPEAPRRAVLNYEPCPKCSELWAQGTACVEVTDRPMTDGQLQIKDGYYPTGRLSVITKEAASRMGIEAPRVLMTEDCYTRIFG